MTDLISLQITLNSARISTKAGLYIVALEKYMKYFEEIPKENRAKNSENEFVDLLCDLEIFFNDTNSLEELVKCFLCALNWIPDNVKLHNRFGSILIKNGETFQGLQYVLRAYKLAQEKKEPRLAIENNILHVIWNQMPRWHFRMLNGKLRNESYRKAISKALDRGLKNVVDIGSGCGLLSLYAGTHHTHPSVIAFESNPILYEKGAVLMTKYCKGVNYHCYDTLSYLIKELKETRRDLLVTEIFDVAVFGEGILKSLMHAFRVIMQEKNFTVIPSRVTVYITGIKCEALDKKYRLQNNISCLQIENICSTKLLNLNPYDAEILIKENYEILTETVEFMDLKFSNKDIIECLLKEQWNSQIHLIGIKKGIIDCLVVWFDLHLDDEIVISTNPFHCSNEPCWEQAIFHCKHPIPINMNEQLSFSVKVEKEHFKFDLIDSPCDSLKCFEISEYAIQFLNDEKWIQYLILLTDTILGDQKLSILDFCAFPIAGLLAAKKGHEVYFFFKEELDVTFIQYIMTKNNIDSSLMNFVEYDNYPQCIMSLEKFDYVVYEPVHQDGSLKRSPMDNVIFQKFEWRTFFEGIIVHFVLIHSQYLDYCNRVNEENVAPFYDIVEEMNEYSGSEHPFLEHNFPHEKMSNEIAWNLVEEPFTVESARCLKDGKINGILTWFTLVGKEGIQFCTKESSNFMKNVLTFPERTLESDECVKILCQYKSSGLLQIEICQEMWLQTNFDRVISNSFFVKYFSKNFRE